MLRIKAAKKLPKKLQKHLSECGINSLQALKDALIHQEREHIAAEEKHGKDIPFFICRCEHCHEVARRLEINVKDLMA